MVIMAVLKMLKHFKITEVNAYVTYRYEGSCSKLNNASYKAHGLTMRLTGCEKSNHLILNHRLSHDEQFY